ncbi:hypothetical protein [Paenibacillus sp. SZ31]|uniref:hypothetical protein n=1 Tax=Paenibacillus sp. SZ31 TaxID=2725555 RepID=UPI002006E272|nr:hypothetical protein [Paenibacillus sp. SZ31]
MESASGEPGQMDFAKYGRWRQGQDFDADWLKLVSACFNEETQSLLLLEGRAQTIFKQKNSLAQDTGLDFRGRSKIPKRNTAQVVQFA